MPIIVQCSCGVKLEVADRLEGTRIACPKCKRPLDALSSISDDEQAVQIQGERISSSKTPVPMQGQKDIPIAIQGQRAEQNEKSAQQNQQPIFQQPLPQQQAHQQLAHQPVSQPASQQTNSQPSPYLAQPSNPFGTTNTAHGRPQPLPQSSANPFQSPTAQKPYSTGKSNSLPGQVIAVSVFGILLGTSHVICGGCSMLGGLFFQSIIIGFSNDERAGSAAQEASMALWGMIFVMLLIVVYGVCTTTGSIGLFFKRKWAWLMSMTCGGISALAMLLFVFLYIQALSELSQPSEYYDMSIPADRAIHEEEVRNSHIGGLIPIFSYGIYAVLSLWILLTPSVRRAFFK